MIYIYINELNEEEKISYFTKIPKWLQSLIWKFIKKSNFIIKKKIEENKIMFLVSNKEKCYKKLKRKIEKIGTNRIQIILAKRVKELKAYLKCYKIVEGKKFFFSCLEEILEKVLKEQPLEMQNIYFLANNYSEQNIMLIKKIAQKVKSTNIITKEIVRYTKLEETVNDQGIAICVANNKRKSLKNAKIIINLDFTKQEIEQYSIFRNAMIINLTQEKLKLKGFEGIVIQDLEIELLEEQINWIKQNRLEKDFKQIELYESIIEEKKQKNLHINNLYGNNGKINEKEIINWKKILTNIKN